MEVPGSKLGLDILSRQVSRGFPSYSKLTQRQCHMLM